MSAADNSGFIPPQQARSRAALERLLHAAEEVLATQGLDDFTIAAVADRAGVSVGGVYRRFVGKEQLLEAVIDRSIDELQSAITTALESATPGLSGVVNAFVQALADYFTRVGPMYAAVIGGPRTIENQDRALAAVAAVQRSFLDAALPYGAEITHRAPSTALSTALRTILAAGVHRAAAIQLWPDGLSWAEWAAEITDMTALYLTTSERAVPRH